MYNKVADYNVFVRKVQYIMLKRDILMYTISIERYFICNILLVSYFNNQYPTLRFSYLYIFVGEIPVHKVLSSSDYKKVFKLPTIAEKCDNFGKPSSQETKITIHSRFSKQVWHNDEKFLL